MPSTYTPSLRLEMQAAGENLNTWGAPRLNAVIDRLDQAIAGRSAIVLAGDHVLTSANLADDEARRAMLDFTGMGPATVTLPAASKIYLVRAECVGFARRQCPDPGGRNRGRRPRDFHGLSQGRLRLRHRRHGDAAGGGFRRP